MQRRLASAVLALIVFGVVGALTFPTDAVVRWMLSRVPLPDQVHLGFTGAVLRPTGLRLDGVQLISAVGRPVFDAEWVRLRPSLWGLWHDGRGGPWSIGAATCQGRIDLEVGTEPGATPIAVTVTQVELASCLPYVLPALDASGRVDGGFTVRVGPPDPTRSMGALDVRGTRWKPGGPLGDLALHADTGRIAWQLADGGLEIPTLEAVSSDFRAAGSGLVRLARTLDESRIDFRLVVTPGPTIPPLLRRYLAAVPGAPPAADGARTLRIQGTLRDPRVVAVSPDPGPALELRP
jgi:type II secretion system protein N